MGNNTQTRFLKFEYDNNIDAATFLAVRYYNWERLDYSARPVFPRAVRAGPRLLAGLRRSDGRRELRPHAPVRRQTHGDAERPVQRGPSDLGLGRRRSIALYGPLVGDFLPPGGPCAGIAAGNGYVSCAYPINTPLAPSPLINFNQVVLPELGSGLTLPVRDLEANARRFRRAVRGPEPALEQPLQPQQRRSIRSTSRPISGARTPPTRRSGRRVSR